MDGAGFVQPPPIGSGSNNGARYTSESVAGLDRLDLITPEIKVDLIVTYKTILDIDYPGVLHRTPGRIGGHQGPDDTIATMHADQILDMGYAEAAWQHAKKKPRVTVPDPTKEISKLKIFANKWGPRVARFIPYLGNHHYNNINPRTWHASTWHGKHPHVRAHNWHCKTKGQAKKAPWFSRVMWCVSIWRSANTAFGTHHDSWTLSYHMVKAYRRAVKRGLKKGWLMNKLVTRWSKKLHKTYPMGGMGQVIQHGWRDIGYHPNSDLLWGEFGESQLWTNTY